MSELTRKQQCQKGEVDWLRNTLKEKDQQITELRVSLQEETTRHKLHEKELETKLLTDTQRLQSELTFKGAYSAT